MKSQEYILTELAKQLAFASVAALMAAQKGMSAKFGGPEGPSCEFMFNDAFNRGFAATTLLDTYRGKNVPLLDVAAIDTFRKMLLDQMKAYIELNERIGHAN